MAKILIDSRDDMISFLDRGSEVVFKPQERINKRMHQGKCVGCDAGRWMPCEEVKCGYWERKDKTDMIFVLDSISPKPRIISFFENLKPSIVAKDINEVDAYNNSVTAIEIE